MTGFGSASLANDELRLEVELRTVNSRFLDLVFKLPKVYSLFEKDLRQLCSDHIQRGRVEIFVSRIPLAESAYDIHVNRALFEAYWKEYQQFFVENDCWDKEVKQRVLADLLARRELIDSDSSVSNVEAELSMLLSVTKSALSDLTEMRASEGMRIETDLAKRLKGIKKHKVSIEALVSNSSESLKTRLIERIEKLSPDLQLDQDRLATEVALLVDRIDVTEELVRLDSHFEQFDKLLACRGNGRKLEFLLQEIGREFNTVASKTQTAEVQALVVDAKAELEKVREQVQNVE